MRWRILGGAASRVSTFHDETECASKGAVVPDAVVAPVTNSGSGALALSARCRRALIDAKHRCPLVDDEETGSRMIAMLRSSLNLLFLVDRLPTGVTNSTQIWRRVRVSGHMDFAIIVAASRRAPNISMTNGFDEPARNCQVAALVTDLISSSRSSGRDRRWSPSGTAVTRVQSRSRWATRSSVCSQGTSGSWRPCRM